MPQVCLFESLASLGFKEKRKDKNAINIAPMCKQSKFSENCKLRNFRPFEVFLSFYFSCGGRVRKKHNMHQEDHFLVHSQMVTLDTNLPRTVLSTSVRYSVNKHIISRRFSFVRFSVESETWKSCLLLIQMKIFSHRHRGKLNTL